MILLNDFIALVCAAVPRFQTHAPNARQQMCILHDPTVPLMIVAGPGSGKTTVLVLRALRLVFVNGWMPEQIVLTTFTRKAAEELRARLIEWGLRLKNYLIANPPHSMPVGFTNWLDTIDINRFLTGTLDSICEELLTTHRDPTDPAPVLVEGFVGNGILTRHALFPNQVHNDPNLDAYLTQFSFDGSTPRNFGQKVDICRTFLDRFVHDLVNMNQYQGAAPHPQARQRLAACAMSYRQFMAGGYRMDFALLEETFLQRLQQGRLQRFTNDLRVLLVDEYQDTNPLQELIYFTIIQQTGASFTIVGDDDQSLYRFRGATVELFRDFQQRFVQQVPNQPYPHLEYLVENYRSTPSIVSFFNTFIQNDANFQPARVQPPKPQIVAQRPANGVPVLGMFRGNVSDLATDLTSFLGDVFRGPGRVINFGGQSITIVRDPNGGDFGDAVLLSHTVNEFATQFGNNPPRERLPRLLRTRLAQMQPPVEVFNPRGRLLRDIPVVKHLLGTILNCIDGIGAQQSTLYLRAEPQRYLAHWRQEARNFAATNPVPSTPHSLEDFVQAWQTRTVQGANMLWPPEWPLLELCFKLMSWLPMLRDDPEGQVYLEAVSRAIAQAATFSPYRSTIITSQQPHDDNSVKAAIRDILAPIAESSVDVDEEIMPQVPRSRFPIMTIHQAKGLEFPLVIVDVASDYTRNHPLNRFRRFPEHPSSVQNVEDDLAPFCQIGPLRQTRTGLQRSFDDLIRLYYVAYSRPECVLMLVGVDPCLRYQSSIRHVATGWSSDGTWSWRTPVAGPAPALVNNHPLLLI
ncbi:MAG: ATP-dependent helicase [Deltaproteobacteria bacterium HGW-Deltaproteobacteria-15]|nr:MAG: ATP-dependent helicase [Deltaproteobacteria bacterium HGW-Deltaproteobacteria-15]